MFFFFPFIRILHIGNEKQTFDEAYAKVLKRLTEGLR